MHVVAREVAAEHGRRASGQRLRQRRGVRDDAHKRSHRGIDHLLREQVRAIRRQHDAVEREPIRDAQQCADVAGVLDAVEREGQPAIQRAGRERPAHDPSDRQHRRRRGKVADALHLRRRHDLVGLGLRSAPFRAAAPILRRINFRERKIRGEQFAHDLFAFHDEQPERLAVLLFLQRAEAGDLGFGERHDARAARPPMPRKPGFSSRM